MLLFFSKLSEFVQMNNAQLANEYFWKYIYGGYISTYVNSFGSNVSLLSVLCRVILSKELSEWGK